MALPPSSYQPTYPNYDELTTTLEAWQAEFPQLLRVESAGKSYEGRDVWLVELTDTSTGPADDKPTMWLDANTHATELAGTPVCLLVLRTLAERFAAGEPAIVELLGRVAFVAIPRVNPDGAEHVLSTGVGIRSGTRSWPDKPAAPGWVPSDMDGDGRVLQMRVKSPGGLWKEYADDPRMLVPRELQDTDTDGPFFHLYGEGKFEGDFDPDKLEVPPLRQGMDFNRNYPYGWRPEWVQKGAGEFPLSESETHAHVRAITSRPRISAALSYHTFCGALLRPFSDKPDTEMDPVDLNVFKAVGKRGTEITGYPCISVFHDFRYSDTDCISGAFDDWAYNHQGLLAYTVEIWNLAKQAGVDAEKFAEFFFKGGRTSEQTAQIIEWCDNNAPEAFVDWYDFDHPQLGTVQIGGWSRLYGWRNPPEGYLADECARNAEYAIELARGLPRMSWVRLSAQAHGGGLYRIEAVVENIGFLPTCGTELGRKFVREVSAELHIDGEVELKQGDQRQDLGHLDGISSLVHRPFVDSIHYSGATRSSVGKAEWWVKGRGQVRVEVDAARGGVMPPRELFIGD